MISLDFPSFFVYKSNLFNKLSLDNNHPLTFYTNG